MYKKEEVETTIVNILAHIILLIAAPFLIILSFNSLFNLEIEMTLGTWFSALWIYILLNRGKGK